MRRLYAGSISYDATQEDITALFEPFGKITCLTISWDEERNHHKVSIESMENHQKDTIIDLRCYIFNFWGDLGKTGLNFERRH